MPRARVPLPLFTLKLIALPTTALLELLTSSSLEQLVIVPTMAAKTAIEKIIFFIVFRIKINKYVNKKVLYWQFLLLFLPVIKDYVKRVLRASDKLSEVDT